MLPFPHFPISGCLGDKAQMEAAWGFLAPGALPLLRQRAWCCYYCKQGLLGGSNQGPVAQIVIMIGSAWLSASRPLMQVGLCAPLLSPSLLQLRASSCKGSGKQLEQCMIEVHWPLCID